MLLLDGTLQDTIIDRFLDRFVIPEQQAIIPFVVLLSLIVALYYVPQLAERLRRGDRSFNTSLIRWVFGLVVVFGMPTLLAKTILDKSVLDVTKGTVKINELDPAAFVSQAALNKSINAQKLNLKNYVVVRTDFENDQYVKLGNDPNAIPKTFGYKVWYPKGLGRVDI